LGVPLLIIGKGAYLFKDCVVPFTKYE